MLEEQALEFGGLMQSAALDPMKWQPALDAVNAFVGASGVALLSVTTRERFTPASSDLCEMMEDYFARGWHLRDRREVCIPLLQAKGIVFDQDFQSAEEVVHGDYYEDFLARHKQKWFAGVGVEVDGDSWCLAFQRSPALGPFGGGDLKRLRLVRGILSNAAHVARQVGRVWVSGLQHALDEMGQPALIFDMQGRVLQLNGAADAIVGSAIGGDRMLRLETAQDERAFGIMIKTALSRLWLTSDTTTIVHLAGARYSCRATSLLGKEGLIATNVAAMVVLEPMRAQRSGLLKRRFALTDAETKVAVALADGRSVNEIASAHRVTAGTIRAQLKSIFVKADINSQSKLVALVHRLGVD